jgi:Recombination endonuclease VII
MRVVTRQDRARWYRTYRFARFGITEDQFNKMLEDQHHACAICREPFQDQRICVDHDHRCCPVPPNAHARSCGKCVRGLLCVRCNTWLGWMEKYGGAVAAYLARLAPAPKEASFGVGTDTPGGWS